MGGYRLWLDVPPEAETADTIVEFYQFVEDKRDTYCDETGPPRIDPKRHYSLRCLHEDGLFYVNAPVYKQLRAHLDWWDIKDLMDDNRIVRGEDITELATLLRRATEQLSAHDNEWDYVCFTETGIVAICEFALRNGYRVKVID